MKIVRLDKSECEILINELVITHLTTYNNLAIYTISKGGLIIANHVISENQERGWQITHDIMKADVILNDLELDVSTAKKCSDLLPNIEILVLYDLLPKLENVRYKFYWDDEIITFQDDVESLIGERLLEHIGEDVNRGGLAETPARFLKAWGEWTSGYSKDPADVVKTFSDGAEDYDEMILVSEIPFYSHCEHHLAPFFGTVTIGYIPDKKILGLSKFARIVDIYSRRLQVQERLTTQIANLIFQELSPLGVGVFIKAKHMCMESRGINRKCGPTITQALLGNFLNSDVKQEYLSLCRSNHN